MFSRQKASSPRQRTRCRQRRGVDHQKSGVVTKWPLKGLRGNYAMALNEADHRLFTITRKTPMIVFGARAEVDGVE